MSWDWVNIQRAELHGHTKSVRCVKVAGSRYYNQNNHPYTQRTQTEKVRWFHKELDKHSPQYHKSNTVCTFVNPLPTIG